MHSTERCGELALILRRNVRGLREADMMGIDGFASEIGRLGFSPIWSGSSRTISVKCNANFQRPLVACHLAARQREPQPERVRRDLRYPH